MGIVTGGTVNNGPYAFSPGISPAQGFRQSRHGELFVSEYAGPHYGMAYDQVVFTAYAAAVATTPVGTGLIGLQLWNGSANKNLVLLECGGMTIVTSATATSYALSFGVAQTGAPTGQTAITKQVNSILSANQPGSAGLALNAGTFTNAPVAFLNLMHNTAAIAATGEDPGFRVDLKGRYIVPPQSYVAIVSVATAIASGGSNLDLTWCELPV